MEQHGHSVTHHDNLCSIMHDFDINILNLTCTDMSIVEFNGSKYKPWSGGMGLLLEQMQEYGIFKREDECPKDAGEDGTAAEKLAHRAAVKDCINQHGTASWTIVLSMEQGVQASFMEMIDEWTLSLNLAAVYKSKLMFHPNDIRERL